MTGSVNKLCALAQTRGWHVLVMHDSEVMLPKIRYDTIDVVDGPPRNKRTKLVDREPVVDGVLALAADRLLDRLSPPDDDGA